MDISYDAESEQLTIGNGPTLTMHVAKEEIARLAATVAPAPTPPRETAGDAERVPPFAHHRTDTDGRVHCACGFETDDDGYYAHILRLAPPPVIRAAKQLMAGSTNFAHKPSPADVEAVWVYHRPWQRGVYAKNAWLILDAALYGEDGNRD